MLTAFLLPLRAARETDELVAAHPEFDTAGQARVRQAAAATADRLAMRFFTVEGRRCAELLPEADLRVLVADAESPAARRLRAPMPPVMVAVASGLAGVDFKREVMTAFAGPTAPR